MPIGPDHKKRSSRGRDRGDAASRPTWSKDSPLISQLEEIVGERVLCMSLSRGALADAIAKQLPDSFVACYFLDDFLAAQAGIELGSDTKIEVECECEFPDGPFDTVAIPFFKNGEAELTRELMQQGHERLAVGGKMLVSTDNPRDRWLQEQMETLFNKVIKRPQSHGVVYIATKTTPLRRVRDFSAEFAFRDGERLVKAVSRPGVFSHRELDVGARVLLEATASLNVVQPGSRILDLGCGAGTVGIALALRAPGVHVHAMDSNPRALQSTTRGAVLNGLQILEMCPFIKKRGAGQSDIGPDAASTLSVQLNSDGETPHVGSFDLVIANPPYYSNWAIATIFLEAAARALKPGGRLFLVTKHSVWYENNLPFLLSDVEVQPVRDYFVVTAVQRPKR